MPPLPEPVPRGLKSWAMRQNPGHSVDIIVPAYVLCDAWAGTVYHCYLSQPNVTPKSAGSLDGYAVALDRRAPIWNWVFRGPKIPDAKSAVLWALRNRN
jgi:hypothetical protein